MDINAPSSSFRMSECAKGSPVVINLPGLLDMPQPCYLLFQYIVSVRESAFYAGNVDLDYVF